MSSPREQERKTLLVLSQVYVPDPAAVGQCIADATFEMARRGYRVVVLAADHGYDDPSRRYPSREFLRGVDVRRIGLCSFGKQSILRRVAGTASFMMQAGAKALLMPGTDAILFSTSPPLIGVVVTSVAALRRIPTAYWAMDLNPDQLVAVGRLKVTSVITKGLARVHQTIVRRASLVVALDRFMAERLEALGPLHGRLMVVPPWPHEDALESVEHHANPFRQKHGLTDKFVVMYSGNHSPSNPLDTVLEAALRLRDDGHTRFVFVGGGTGKRGVEQFVQHHGLGNVLSLPYQPFQELKYSLSAADVHVVSMGNGMRGIIHPSKIYNAMAVARPILFLGPRPSHVADLLDQHGFGSCVRHGDVDGAVEAIQRLKAMDALARRQMGELGQKVLKDQLSQTRLCGKLCDALELLWA